MDSVIDKEDQLVPLREECVKRGLLNCLSLLDEFETLTSAIIEIIKLIDIESQLVIMHHRNTIVHARVLSIHNKNNGFPRYLDPVSNQIKKFNGTNEDFWNIYRIKIKEGLDNFFTPKREMFFSKGTTYFRLLCQITNKDFFDKLTSIAYSDL